MMGEMGGGRKKRGTKRGLKGGGGRAVESRKREGPEAVMTCTNPNPDPNRCTALTLTLIDDMLVRRAQRKKSGSKYPSRYPQPTRP